MRGGRPDPRTRIERIMLEYRGGLTQHGHRVSVIFGNSHLLIPSGVNIGHKESWVGDTSVYHLMSGGELPDIVIYPFGIVNVTNENRPVFEDPRLSTNCSIALEFKEKGQNNFLKMPVEPLFNISPDGAVLTRVNASPTSTELQFLESISEEIASATSRP